MREGDAFEEPIAKDEEGGLGGAGPTGTGLGELLMVLPFPCMVLCVTGLGMAS